MQTLTLRFLTVEISLQRERRERREREGGREGEEIERKKGEGRKTNSSKIHETVTICPIPTLLGLRHKIEII